MLIFIARVRCLTVPIPMHVTGSPPLGFNPRCEISKNAIVRAFERFTFDSL